MKPCVCFHLRENETNPSFIHPTSSLSISFDIYCHLIAYIFRQDVLYFLDTLMTLVAVYQNTYYHSDKTHRDRTLTKALKCAESFRNGCRSVVE